MFLGFIFGSDDFLGLDKFYPFGFLGYIIIICYFIFIVKYRKRKNQGFEFSFFIFIVYFFFVLKFTIEVRGNITCFNQVWPVPFLLCIIVELIVYFIRDKGNNNTIKKGNSDDA